MFEKLEQESVLENKARPHPTISFVYIRGKQYFCLQHPEHTSMNRGAMKQHIRGKQHGLDFETGEKISQTEHYFSDISKHMKNNTNQHFVNSNSEKDHFWELKEKIDVFDLPQIVKDVLLADHGLEGKLKDEVLSCLFYQEATKNRE